MKIGYICGFSTHTPFWTIAEHGVRQAARELGAALTLRFCADELEVLAAFQDLIRRRLDAILFAPFGNLESYIPTYKDAKAAGIPLVLLDQPQPYPVDCLVKSDDARGAAAGASYLAERLGGLGKVLHLQGEMSGPVSRLRSEGVHQILDSFPSITLIDTDRALWHRERAQHLTQQLFVEHPDIRGVICASDPMALGAVDALAQIGRAGEVVVVGVDGDADALIALQAGTLAATIRRSPYKLGRVAVETAVRIARGVDTPALILLDDMSLVTRENVAEAALDMLSIMPGVISQLAESSTIAASDRQLLRTIIDTLPDMIYVKDRDGRFEVANQALAQVVGVSHSDALIGKTDAELFPPTLADQYHADEQALFASGEPMVNKEEPLVAADGAQRWLVTTKIPLRDHQGRVVRLVGRGQDITERRQSEQERQQLQEDLIQAQAVALEELSTPLIPINDKIVVMPLIGRIDSQRAERVLETLLNGIAAHHADLAIIDITGVSVVDTQVANALIQTARAVRLVGAQVVLTGIRPEVAQTLVSLGVDLGDIVTRSTLQSGIAYSLSV